MDVRLSLFQNEMYYYPTVQSYRVKGRIVTVRCTGAAKLNTKPEEVDTKGFISTEIAHTQADSTADSSV